LTVFVKPPKNASGGRHGFSVGDAQASGADAASYGQCGEAGSSMALRLLNRKASERFAGRPGSRLKEIEQ
jgi:hypothetical protein